MSWRASAPANIALIKYMGKTNAADNIPTNASLSYTLDHLITTVTLEAIQDKQDCWEPLDDADIQLSTQGQQRFLNYLTSLKQQFGYNGHFLVRSTNNFPADCGLASSASSYAALTKCAITALCQLTQQTTPDLITQAEYSRKASGSSCRSFHSGWVLWQGARVQPVDFPYKNLHHQVIVVSHAKKTPSSSEAHQRIQTSACFNDRPERAEQRLRALMQAFTARAWQTAYEIVWEEFQDMHQLFATAIPAFSYMTSDSKAVLSILEQFWHDQQDGPLVTMDAGPNIHLLYRPDQQRMAATLEQQFAQKYDVLSNDQFMTTSSS